MIVNKGNTCYLGAALQCVIRTDSLDRFIQQADRQRTREAILYYKVHTAVRKGDVCDPEELYKKIKSFYKPFNNLEQNDAHEAVLVILDYLSTFMERIPNTRYIGKSNEGRLSWGERYSIIDEIFKIQFETRIKCTSCKHALLKYECAYGIYDTFTGIGEHALPGYKCDHCHRLDTCKEHVSVSHYPSSLIVRVRPTWDIRDLQFRIGSYMYSMYAVCRYIPSGTKDHGHYNVGVLQQNGWYLIDDDVVTEKPVDYILRNASVLFLQIVSRVE